MRSVGTDGDRVAASVVGAIDKQPAHAAGNGFVFDDPDLQALPRAAGLTGKLDYDPWGLA